MTQASLRSVLVAVCIVTLQALAGCSGKGGPPTQVSSEFTPADAALFDDGIDFIASSVALQGRWQEDWANDLRQRVERADVVAAVRVRTVVTDVSPQGDNGYRIAVDVDDTLQGKLPGDEVTLRSTPESRGYRTVEARTQNMEAGDFLLFGKWAEGEAGEVLRFHLAPNSDDVRAAVTKMLEPAGPPNEVVSVHALEE